MSRRTDRQFSKEETQMASRYLAGGSASQCQGNANQNCKELSPPTCQNGCPQGELNDKLVRMWKKRNPVHCWWEGKLVWSLWKMVGRFLKLGLELAWEVKGALSCLTLCNPVDCIVHRILQDRILEWGAFPFSRGSFQPRDWTQVLCVAGRFFTSLATREDSEYWSG